MNLKKNINQKVANEGDFLINKHGANKTSPNPFIFNGVLNMNSGPGCVNLDINASFFFIHRSISLAEKVVKRTGRFWIVASNSDRCR